MIANRPPYATGARGLSSHASLLQTSLAQRYDKALLARRQPDELDQVAHNKGRGAADGVLLPLVVSWASVKGDFHLVAFRRVRAFPPSALLPSDAQHTPPEQGGTDTNASILT